MIKLKDEYLSFFIEEIQEIIDRLEEAMLSYKENISNNEFNQSIKRDFHTLKGDFLTYSFKKYSDYFHKVEDFWEDKTMRHATSENILNNISEIREFLRIVSDSGLERARDFEDKSNIMDFLINGRNNVSYDEVAEVNSIENTKEGSKEVEEKIDTYTFYINTEDDKDLKVEEIEQFFKFYGTINYIKNTDKQQFMTVISTSKLKELLSDLNHLIDSSKYEYVKGSKIGSTKNIDKQVHTNIELQELKSIKVNTSSLDFLLNDVGELITKHSSLYNYKDELGEKSRSFFEELLYNIDKITKDIQQGIFDMRLIPCNYLFSQLRRIIRDISHELDKEVKFDIIGETIQLDKEIIDKLSAPLKHMLKNSLDHGIETPKERSELGKNPKGNLRLELYQKGEYIAIEVYDDGRGLDKDKILKKAIEKGIALPDKKYTHDEIMNFIFDSGFSTSKYISEISGRGVGMNVVKNNIDELNGEIEIDSQKGVYTLFRITLPTSLSVIDGFLIKMQEEQFVIPVSSIVEILDRRDKDLKEDFDNNKLIFLGDEYNLVFKKDNFLPYMYLLIEGLQNKVALPIEEVLNRRQFIIKKINIKGGAVEKYLGATILSTGESVLVINPRKLL